MPSGDGFRSGWASGLAVAEETVFGTFVQPTVAFSPIGSVSLHPVQPKEAIDTVNATRDRMQVFQMLRKVEGSVEVNFNVTEDFCIFLLKQAFGGTMSTAFAGGTSTTGRTHTLNGGDMESNAATGGANAKALSFWVRWGDGDSDTAFGFRGCRVNSLTLTQEMAQPLKMNAEIIGVDGSATTFALTPVFGGRLPLLFNEVTVTQASTLASITAGTVFKYQKVELTISNNLGGDNESYSLGGDTLDVLPPAGRDISLKLTARYDSITPHDRWRQNTNTAIRLHWDTGATMTAITGDTTFGLIIDLPHCKWITVDEPEISDLGLLTHELELMPFRLNTNTNFAIQAQVRNLTTGY